MASTSVPHWTESSVYDVEFDASASRHLIFTVGPDARAHVAAHRSALPDPVDIVDLPKSADSEAVVAAALAGARAGWRFVVVGAGSSLMRIRALIIAAGAMDAEIITVHLGGDSGFAATDRDVHCAHCRTVTSTSVPIGEMLCCSGCGVELVVYHHFSRRHGAYLGYRPDSEELTGTGDG